MNELLAEGLQLMGVGMGIVFLFLGMLVGIVTLVSCIIQNSEAEVATATSSEDDLLEVVTEAVKRYRAEHNQ